MRVLLVLLVSAGCTGTVDPTKTYGDSYAGDDASSGDVSVPGDPGRGDPVSGDSPPFGDTRVGDPRISGDPGHNGDIDPLAGLPRGLRWTRENPMFISGLNVVMGPPPAGFVYAYYDDFNATATHTWARGLPDTIDGWAAAEHPDFRWVSWVDNDGTSQVNQELIGGYPADVPGRIGYQVGDEPGLLCDSAACAMAELQEIEAGVNAIRAQDPDALIFVNFTKDADGLDNLLNYYGSTMDADIVSYDYYSRDSYNNYTWLDTFRVAGLTHQKPYWRYLKSYYAGAGDDPLTESDMRWNAFCGLVYGYTGFTWFFYQIPDTHEHSVALFETQGEFNSVPTAEWHMAKQINHEMKNLGRAITQLTSVAVNYKSGSVQPLGTSAWSAGSGGNPYLSGFATQSGGLFTIDALLGLFVDYRGDHYMMIQNTNHSNAQFPNDNSDSGTITLTFDFSTAPATLDRSALWTLDRLTGEVVSVPLTGSGSQRTLAVEVAAGDVELYKFKTGRPFVLQL